MARLEKIVDYLLSDKFQEIMMFFILCYLFGYAIGEFAKNILSNF